MRQNTIKIFAMYQSANVQKYYSIERESFKSLENPLLIKILYRRRNSLN